MDGSPLKMLVLLLSVPKGTSLGVCPADQLDCSGACCTPSHPWPQGQAAATCCGGGCCTHMSTCSAVDEPDGACCSDQVTRPCAAVGAYPARCCGRWTVCCSVGTVGCCDPALPWQGESGRALAAPAGALQPHAAASMPHAQLALQGLDPSTTLEPSAAPPSARPLGVLRALLLEVSQLSVATIDPASGKVLSSARVRGFDNFGQATRPWAWSGSQRAFVTVEANFSAAPPQPGGQGRGLVLTRVDASSGQATSLPVRGAAGLPAGYCTLDGAASLLVGLHADESARTPAEASLARFVVVDIETAAARPVASAQRGADESSASYYAAHFYACSRDGSAVARVGARRVSIGEESGVGLTQLGGDGGGAAAASSRFEPLAWAKGGLGPLTLQPDGAAFLSLGPHAHQGLALVRWALTSRGAPALVAKLGARTAAPSVPVMGPLGYLADALSADGAHYAALVSEEVLPAIGRWAVATVEIGSGKVSVHALSPLKLVATVGVSGLGLDER